MAATTVSGHPGRLAAGLDLTLSVSGGAEREWAPGPPDKPEPTRRQQGRAPKDQRLIQDQRTGPDYEPTAKSPQRVFTGGG
ncbi:hypothetical protein Acsp02_17940 [Actinoplanes sp. NBRC 103695]|nr:hypothetical protein Acsp02_17940 [Actinoplanes sp. NBRC 103695]